MAHNPCISVVIPTYNRAEMLTTVLPSYLQSALVAEVIIVDDAGTDGTADAVNRFLLHDSRIRYVRQPRNQGAPAARNRGAQLARGEWVLQSEDDLALADDCLDFLLAHALASGADIIGGRRIWMRLGETSEQAIVRTSFHQGRLINPWLLDFNSQVNTGNDVESLLLDGTMLIRREIFDDVQYYEPYGGQSTWREESDFQVSAGKLGYRLVFCPHAVTYHFSRASQSYGKNRLRGTIVYAYRVAHNNLVFLRRHKAYLRAKYPQSILFGLPLLSGLFYGVYRLAWLLGIEIVRSVRAARHGAFNWE